jgi:hypothetical protein
MLSVNTTILAGLSQKLKRLNREKGHEMGIANELEKLMFEPVGEKEKAIFTEVMNIPVEKVKHGRPEKGEGTVTGTIIV